MTKRPFAFHRGSRPDPHAKSHEGKHKYDDGGKFQVAYLPHGFLRDQSMPSAEGWHWRDLGESNGPYEGFHGPHQTSEHAHNEARYFDDYEAQDKHGSEMPEGWKPK